MLGEDSRSSRPKGRSFLSVFLARNISVARGIDIGARAWSRGAIFVAYPLMMTRRIR
jgi:hypothetical protein